MLLGTLAAALAFAGQAQGAPLPLQNAIITASYNGQASGMLGLDHGFADEPGSNVTALDPTGTGGVEFLTGDYKFGFDFSDTGLLTVMANGFIDAGSYLLRFDFGDSLALPLTGLSLQGGDIGGIPGLTLIDSHTIGLDLSGVSWRNEFSSFNVQIDAAVAADVPEPAAIPLLLAGLAGAALARRRRQR